MITITITLPPKVDPKIVDALVVTLLDDTHDRLPRGTYLEGLQTTDESTVLIFTT